MIKKITILVAILLPIIHNIFNVEQGAVVLQAQNVRSTANPQKSGNVLKLSALQGTYNANSYLEILEDTTASLSFADICSPRYDSAFKHHNSHEEPNFGYTSSAFWVRLRLCYQDDVSGSHNIYGATDWFLSSEYPFMDNIQLYSPRVSISPSDSNAATGYVMAQSGDHFPFSMRAVEYRMPNFQLPKIKDSTFIVYLRLENQDPMDFPIVIRSSQDMSSYIGTEQFILGMFYGLLIIVLCYNLLMYLSLRDVNFGYYVLYILFYGLYLFTYNGLDFQYLFPNSPYWHNRFVPIILGLTLASTTQFAQSYLNTALHTPRLNKILTAIKIYYLLIPTLGLFWFWQSFDIVFLGFRMLAPAMLIGTSFTTIAAIIMVRRNSRPARYFLAGVSFLGLAVTIGILRAYDILVPNNSLTLYSLQIGSSLEILCLSLGLADRLNIIRREKKQAQAELIAVLQSSEQMLEQLVEDRTAELRESNLALEEANRFKTEMLSVASHDLKNPLGQIMVYAELVEMELHNTEAASTLLHHLQHSAKGMLELIKNILDSAAMELGKISITTERFSLSLLLTSICDVYSYQAGKKNQTIVMEIDDNLTINGDAERLQQVFDNLLSNAVKYSPHGKKIWLRALASEDKVRVEVQDEGPGLTEDDKAKLFGFFQRLSAQTTGGESSNGVGLAIVKKIVDLHEGQIWVESKIGYGAMFIVELPIHGRTDNG